MNYVVYYPGVLIPTTEEQAIADAVAEARRRWPGRPIQVVRYR